MSLMDNIPLPYKTPEEKEKYELNKLINCYKLPQKTPAPHDNKSVSCFIDGYITDADGIKSATFKPLYTFKRSLGNDLSPKDYLPDWALESNIEKSSKNAEYEYHFENESEYSVYMNTHPNTNAICASPDDYLELYKKGFLLVKYNHFSKAIDFLERSISINPVAIKARFELVEAWLRLNSIPDIKSRFNRKWFESLGHQFDPDAFKSMFMKAKKELLRMSVFFYHNTDIAKFYRKLGFIEAGLLNYKTAIACYKYSLNFEDHYSVKHDINDIVELSKKASPLRIKPSLSLDPEKYLIKSEIPVLKPFKTDA